MPSDTLPSTPRPLVEITDYTDPLCCWSWAFEPQWRRLRTEYGERIAWRYRMGGMIPDWQRFDDPLNAVAKPSQMGPHWYQVATLSGMPIDAQLWHDDPPASSFPACLAFKAAELQGDVAAERYLRRLREAAMLERRNIARPEVLVALANELAGDPGAPLTFDSERFAGDLRGHAALIAFREDIQDIRYREIGRFPSLIMRHPEGQALLIVGYRPYDALQAAVRHLAPDLGPAEPVADAVAYTAIWGRVTAREVAEALAIAPDEATCLLTAAVAAGELEEITLPHLPPRYRMAQAS